MSTQNMLYTTLSSLQQSLESINIFLKQYGIEMYVYKIKLYREEAKEHKPIDQDCIDASLCIDWVVRIKCTSEEVCKKLREAYE